MTEKRFKLDYDDEDCSCISNFLDNGEKLTDSEVVDLLNEQDGVITNQAKKIVRLEKELYTIRNKCKNERENKNYYKNRCINLENKVNEREQMILDLTDNQAVTVIKMKEKEK